MQIIPTEILDKDGNMERIEFYDMAGTFVIQAEWDPNDPQDSEHRAKFREWAYRMVEQTDDFEVIK
jgi:hypothetical protein